MSLKPNSSIKLKILFENEDVIVIDKPANLLVHPVKDENDTLVNGLLAYYPAIKNVGDDERRPGIVHRLDKDTSGLLVVAKNNNSFQYLKKQFQAREIKKKYLTLVHGKVKDEKGIITKVISASKNDYRRKTTFLDNKAKKAVTRYQVIKYYPSTPRLLAGRSGNKNLLSERGRKPESKTCQYTLLEACPETGRTHQIRVHLASIGHPIAGDQQYKFKRQITPQNLKRQFLHAQHLKFRLPNGKMVEFKSELPDDLKKVIDEL